jgi:hypothetical protein
MAREFATAPAAVPRQELLVLSATTVALAFRASTGIRRGMDRRTNRPSRVSREVLTGMCSFARRAGDPAVVERVLARLSLQRVQPARPPRQHRRDRLTNH